MHVCIMQPYYAPAASYFRLFEAVDTFVYLDDVQFMRRGRVHRTQVLRGGKLKWKTLPLLKMPQDTLIKDLKWRDDRYEYWCGSVLHYLISQLETYARGLGLRMPETMRSWSLGTFGLKGQDRIIEICKRVSATTYVNLPGGRDLYDRAAFAQAGIELKFLKPWDGQQVSILSELENKTLAELADEIRKQTILED